MEATHRRSELTLNKGDNSALSLDQDELAFFRFLTKIDNDDELKTHIVRVQQRAYEVSEQFNLLVGTLSYRKPGLQLLLHL